MYFYSKTRPKSEDTGRHSTVYVERPLPEHIQPGTTLTEHDYQQIQNLLTRRDQHLARVYRHNHRLQNVLDKLTNNMAANAARRALNIAKRVKSRLGR